MEKKAANGKRRAKCDVTAECKKRKTASKAKADDLREREAKKIERDETSFESMEFSGHRPLTGEEGRVGSERDAKESAEGFEGDEASGTPVESDVPMKTEGENDAKESAESFEGDKGSGTAEENDVPVETGGENDAKESAEGFDGDEGSGTAEENDVPVETEGEKRKYIEYYLDGYCFRNKGREQFYAKDSSGDEIYWKDSVGTETYAIQIVDVDSVPHRVEYPAIRNGKPSYIYERAGKPRYPMDLNTDRVMFPRDPTTNEEIYLLDKMGNLFYPENKYGVQFYRKDAEGNEVVINNTYAQYANGTQIYPRKANGDCFYIEIENKQIPALKKIEKTFKPYYAEKANGDEIYPRAYIEE